jgi:hypothetical protein
MTLVGYDSINGVFTLSNQKGDPSYYSRIVEATCFDNYQANTCVTFVNDNAIQINSKYNHNIVGLEIPTIQGILLKNAQHGDTGLFCNTPGTIYDTDGLLPGGYGDLLYVGQNGILTNIVPSLAAGDIWFIQLGTKIEDYKFLYAPTLAINIIDHPIPNPTPEVIGNAEKVVLSQAMSKFTAFRIDSTGKAFKVTANDVQYPIVDGITLEAGTVNQQVSVARLKNYYYETGNYFVTSDVYWLDTTGLITTVRPTNALFQVIIGRSIPNSTQFIFDPQPPIRLVQ